MTAIVTRTISEAFFPWTNDSLVKNLGTYGRIEVGPKRHQYKSGALREDAAWWDWETGEILGDRVNLDAQSYGAIFGSTGINNVSGNGLNVVRVRLEPGPAFTAEHSIALTVSHRCMATLEAIIAGNTETTGVACESQVRVIVDQFGEQTELMAHASATGSKVHLNRELKTTLRAKGAATVSSDAQGEAGTTDPGVKAKLNVHREIGGETEGERSYKLDEDIDRVAPTQFVDVDLLTVNNSATDTLTLVKRESREFLVTAQCSASTSSSSDSAIARGTVLVDPVWAIDVAVMHNGQQVALYEPLNLTPDMLAMVERRHALSKLVTSGIPLPIAARAMGLESMDDVLALEEVAVPDDFAERDTLLDSLMRF